MTDSQRKRPWDEEGEEPKGQSLNMSVRVDADLVRKIRLIMGVRNIKTMTLFITEALESLVEDETKRIADKWVEMAEEQAGKDHD